MKAGTLSILDVRSPCEFRAGHIPGAINVPLFSDAERAAVGIAYKHQGRIPAVQLGIGFVSARLPQMIATAVEAAIDGEVSLHCWRGGMRSRSFAQFLELVDLRPKVLEGGYKGFRRHAQRHFEIPYQLYVVSGLTGVGKTRILHALASAGQQVIDLEALANHRGSAFGGIGMKPQPTTEQFENELFKKLEQLDASQPIWVEDEGQHIGSIFVPTLFFQQIRHAPAVFIECSRTTRVENLLRDYGDLPPSDLIAAVDRIQKRLDGKLAQEAVVAIQSGQPAKAIEIVLDYYDRTYHRAKQKIPRTTFIPVWIDGKSDSESVVELLAICRK